ncbi:hypothetical protein EDD90_1444 [Streptomyces sp. Ag109_O5-1]|uniref:hypothetical protein n=1 Tax=unclassified Streptomyces TaxID=2593676 RepID=UPI000F506BB1|nr:hypothetical protein [Streptomyces sp. Ag109_O5-1]RPE38544.1 hypothetical protein EDD90_1444 [Streptomyces sp. Ag109_O5-1]
MKKFAKRFAVTVSSVALAGVAVLGAGGTASAATPASTHAHRPAVGGDADYYRWDHGVGYLLEQGYAWDDSRGWYHDGRVADSARRDRDDHLRRWERDGRYRDHHDLNHADW